MKLTNALKVVYRTIPTSNHNSVVLLLDMVIVVYRTIPTSNHNSVPKEMQHEVVVYRTIPTSNHNPVGGGCLLVALYIVLFLHQTTTLMRKLMQL